MNNTNKQLINLQSLIMNRLVNNFRFTGKKAISVVVLLSLLIQQTVYIFPPTLHAAESASESADLKDLLAGSGDEASGSASSELDELIKKSLERSNQSSARLQEDVTVQTLTKKSYQYKEKVVFNVYHATEGVDVTITDDVGDVIPVQMTESQTADDTMRVTVTAPWKMKPGKYKLRVGADGETISTQDFTWGVLAINTDKSIYLFNETAEFSIAVLDETGEMVCNAKLSMTITDPLGVKKTISSESGEIMVNDQCSSKALSLTPDYQAEFALGDIPGNYKVALAAEAENGSYTVHDTFEVRETVEFDVRRETATRLYPAHTYPVDFEIIANSDFKGRITEVVPEVFDVSQLNASGVEAYEKVEIVSQSEVAAERVLGSRALRLPFQNEHEITLGFGQDLLDSSLRGKYKEYGVMAHDGTDFAMEVGTPINPIDTGEIILAQENGDYGMTMVVAHEWGRSYYGHLSEFKKHVGDKVYKDDVIALSGNSGLSTGAHLHLGVKLNKHDRYNGFYGKINPATLLGLDTDGEVLGASADPRVKVKVITWEVDVKRGDTVRLGYQFKAPEESPQFYRLGALRFFNEDDSLTFIESRQWQLAVDAAIDPVVGFFSPPATWTSAGNADLNLVQPDPRNGDLMVAVIAIRPAASTVNTPSGWTLLDSRSGTDGGAEGSDTGSVSLYWFYKVADGTEGTSIQAFTENGTTSVWIGQIMQARSATGTYDLSAGGYSINGDATNWGGTLDTDIGVRSGDLVLMAAAQNGNLAGTSGQNFSAANVTTKSTGNEHGEFTTTTGNQVEVGLATSYVWEGNNTTTPTITTTMSSAVSGALTVVRVRQGAGVNRTDTWVRAAGKQIAGTTSVAVSYPEHEIGDMAILYVGSRGSTNPTINTPTGWTSLGTYTGGAGAWTADSGDAVVAAFYREIDARNFSTTQTVSITNGLTSIGQMITVHKDDVGSWSIDSDGGSDDSGGTSWSATGSGMDLSSSNGGDILLALSSINTDGQTYSSHTMSAPGMTFGDVTQATYFTSTASNDMTLEGVTGRIIGGSDSTVAPTFTSVASGSTANSPAGATLFVKIKGNNINSGSAHVGFFSPGRVWTAAANGNLNLRQPDPRNGDLMVATIAIRPATSTINTPAGWTLLDSWTATDGLAEGSDVGSVGFYIFHKVADGTEGTANQTFTENGTTSVWTGSIMQVRSATGTYEISAGAYSVNGDTNTWSGVLDEDIGMTAGDLVLLAAAQNGDTTSNNTWDLTAEGITSHSTINEHGEFASTTGNDVKVGIAAMQIWEGTNTSTPIGSTTYAGAVSGVFSAIRIRQGSGTPRTDTWVRSAGAQVAGTISLAVPYPDHDVGDMFVLFVGNRDASDTTPYTPDGWTSLGTFIGGAGGFGADSGNSRISAYYREATSRRMGTAAVSISSSNTSIAQMVSVRRENVTSWSIDSDGGSDDTSGTAWSTTGSGIDLDSASGGDLLLVGSSMNTDASLYSNQALSASGITFGEVTEMSEFRSTTGNDMTLELATGRIAGGSATNVAPTYTATASPSTSNGPAGGSVFVKIIGNVSGGGPETPVMNQLMRHGQWFNAAGAIQPFTF